MQGSTRALYLANDGEHVCSVLFALATLRSRAALRASASLGACEQRCSISPQGGVLRATVEIDFML